jgi:ABC-2 type transport system permease protein
MDKLLIKLVYLFKGIINKQGIDFNRMITIVETKLTMDKRRVYMNWKQKQQKKENTNHLNGILAFYAIMGVFIGAMLFAIPSLILGMVIIHSYVLFMMSMTLITDFSTVLLDTTDNQVILPKPVSSKTLFMARLVHILVYLLQFTIAIALIPIVITFFKYGIVAGLIMMVTTLLTVLLAVFITYLLYLLIIRFSSEEKVKDIVTYFQIFMTITFTIGIQVVPRMINLQQLTQVFTFHWYSYLLPPVWMALTIEAFKQLQFDAIHVLMILLSVIVPIGTFWAMNKYLAPSFAKKLASLSANDSTKKVETAQTIQQKKQPISKILSGVFCKSAFEKSTFEMTWKMTGRDKSFKLQFYPSLAYVPVFIFIFVFKSGSNIAEAWQSLPTHSWFLLFLYIPMLALTGSILIVAFNENYQASWIYHSLPIFKPGELVVGMLKSLFVKFFLPVFFILFGFCLYIWGVAIIDDALFALANNLFCFMVVANLSDHYLPFSRQPNTQQQTGKFIKTMAQMLIIGLTIGIHYLLIKTNMPWLLWLLTPIMAFIGILLIKRLQQLKWYQISI